MKAMLKTILLSAVLSLLATAAFADADLSVTMLSFPDLAGGARNTITYSIRNNGPDEAKGVVFTLTTSLGTVISSCARGCVVGNVPVGTQVFSTELDVPDTVAGMSLVVSVTSSTPDPNLNNNRFATTLRIEPNPNDIVRLFAPLKVDLAFPFTLSVGVQRASAVHDVDTTIELRPDVTVKTLPDGCTNPAAGKVVCHSDATSGNAPSFVITLYAPRSYGDGFIPFTATSTERVPGAPPVTNTTSTRTQLWFTIYVTSTADSGAGSLRQAILDANTSSDLNPLIAFRIDDASTTPWKTIRVTSPLPAVTAYSVRIDGGTQAGFFGDANPAGPDIEISGGGSVDGHGLLLATCGAEVANLAIGGFRANGLSVAAPTSVCTSYYTTELHHLFIGTDPTGSFARPNARGIGTSVPNGNDFNSAGVPTNIANCVISGNTFSGVFGLSGRLNITNSRIGVKATTDEPLPNGTSGVFIGTGGYGSVVGADFLGFPTSTTDANVIAFNGETGVAIAAGVKDVAIRNNRIWSNKLLGIDVGLDGPTASAPGTFGDPVNAPVLTNAHFDPVSNKTIIEGDIP
ncbi:MAG: right-handed parallel beta-helix repeat-containing protein, partial [Acidobacteria bacterium]|nr:right-handed parallel beta-helix repeat-containing protein [Acidobacteriota bacterium]